MFNYSHKCLKNITVKIITITGYILIPHGRIKKLTDLSAIHRQGEKVIDLVYNRCETQDK